MVAFIRDHCLYNAWRFSGQHILFDYLVSMLMKKFMNLMFFIFMSEVLVIFLALFHPSFVYAKEESTKNIYKEERIFSVKLGSSRIIYLHGSKGSTVSVQNEHDYPMLVQTQIVRDDNELKESTGRFSAVPPLFRLDGNQRSKVRIAHTGGNFPDDRESLYWLCVKAISPRGSDGWSEGKAPDSTNLAVQITINNCIKLLVRPKGLAGKDSLSMAERITWRMDNKGLTALNPTPFYINLRSLTLGGKTVDNVTHIAPFSSHTFDLPHGASGDVQWRAISDLGGDGPLTSYAF